MQNFKWSKLKAFMMLLTAAVVMYSCSKESFEDDLQDKNLQSVQMRSVASDCEADCIEPGSSNFYPVSDMATLSVGVNTKSVSYTAYNTETDFVVEVTYTITAGPSKAKATITIVIDGDEVEFTEVSSGSTVSHTVPLAEGWAGCDEVSFSVVQEGLGTPITFSESYSLIPVCSEYQGCSPAYWQQPQHFDQWVGYAPTDSYADVFGVARSGSLLQNITATGDGVDALVRHSVAALLNATSPDVDYDLTVAEVIAAVQAAFATGNFEATKDRLEGFNEQGCPLSAISLKIGDTY